MTAFNCEHCGVKEGRTPLRECSDCAGAMCYWCAKGHDGRLGQHACPAESTCDFTIGQLVLGLRTLSLVDHEAVVTTRDDLGVIITVKDDALSEIQKRGLRANGWVLYQGDWCWGSCWLDGLNDDRLTGWKPRRI